MVDFRAELAALVAAYDEHGDKWPQHHKEALQQAVEHARAVLNEPAAIEFWHIPRALSDKALRLLTKLPMEEIEARLRGPAPTADGEVAKLVAALRIIAVEADRACQLSDADVITCAADLLERQAASLPVARLPENAQAIEPANHVILAPIPTPIPVSERLPEPKDCDAEGRCWWGDAGDDQFVPSWRLCEQPDDTHFAHWLPAHALPLPEVE